MIETVQTYLMYGCLAALAVLASIVFLFSICAPTWDAVRRFSKLPRIQQVVLLVVAIGFIQYGATKGTSISFDGGIKQNNLQPSSVSNNTVKIYWMRDTSGGVLVPSDAPVYIDYRLSVDTNGVWQTLGESTVGAWQWIGVLANATNYDYNVWAYYVPPEPVHTNGVWLYRTLEDRNERYPIPLRARIEINGKAIATPKEKRKDEGND